MMLLWLPLLLLSLLLSLLLVLFMLMLLWLVAILRDVVVVVGVAVVVSSQVMKCGEFQSNVYLNGDSFGVLSSDPAVPAWLVKVVHTTVETSMNVERRFMAVDLPSSLVDSFGEVAVSVPVLRWASQRPVADEPVQLTRFEPALAKKKKAAGGKTGKKLAAADEAEPLEPRDVIGCAGLKLKRSRAQALLVTDKPIAAISKSKAKANKLVAHLLT
jgi:hypothetical protein